MNLSIDKSKKVPIYLQIARAIEKMIRENSLPEGYKLPSERQLAAELGVHRNTIVKAYFELISDELIIASRQTPRGYFVGNIKPADDPARRFSPLEKLIRYDYDAITSQLTDLFFTASEECPISMSGTILKPKIEYTSDLEQLIPDFFLKSGCSLDTYLKEVQRTKDNIGKLLAKQNIYVPEKNIQLISECNQAVSYLMDLYAESGACILAEEPMGADTATLIRNKGIRIITIPMESDGVNLAEFEIAVRRYKPKFFYMMPNFHNPTGITTSLEKRKRILEIANRYGMLIIENDWSRWFHFEETQIPSMYMMDHNKSVVYLDSFTIFFPYGIKIGYLIGPPELTDMVDNVIKISETVPANIGQCFLNAYLENGKFGDFIKETAVYCREKCQHLCVQLDTLKEKGLTYIRPAGGLTIWCSLPSSINEEKVFEEMFSRGISICPGKIFYRSNPAENSHFRLCFTNASDEEITQAVAALSASIDAAQQA